MAMAISAIPIRQDVVTATSNKKRPQAFIRGVLIFESITF